VPRQSQDGLPGIFRGGPPGTSETASGPPFAAAPGPSASRPPLVSPPVSPSRHRVSIAVATNCISPTNPRPLRDASCFHRIFTNKLRPFCYALLIRETSVFVRCPALRLTYSIAAGLRFCYALLIRETSVLMRCPAIRLTDSITGGLRVIAHANDGGTTLQPKKGCLHSFPP
jgi:hypothetical protein